MSACTGPNGASLMERSFSSERETSNRQRFRVEKNPPLSAELVGAAPPFKSETYRSAHRVCHGDRRCEQGTNGDYIGSNIRSCPSEAGVVDSASGEPFWAFVDGTIRSMSD